MFLHPVTFGNADTFCRRKSLRQVQVDVAVQFAQLFLADGGLHFYGCSPKILGQQDGTQFARSLQQSGYATDPMYADKLGRIINGTTLRQALAG